MFVIEQPTVDPYKMPCPACKAVIGFWPWEVKKERIQNFRKCRYFIVCPVCGEDIITGFISYRRDYNK